MTTPKVWISMGTWSQHAANTHLYCSQPNWDTQRLLPPDDVLQVPFDQIRVAVFPELVVMQVIMLHIPSLGLHPVKPVYHATLRAERKEAAVEPTGDLTVTRLQCIVTSVADMMSDHGPAGHDCCGHEQAA